MMGVRGYQHDFSTTAASIHDRESRRRKAATILAVLADWSGRDLARQRVLDVGASTGAIDDCLAEHFGEVVGIDIDARAIEYARREYRRDNLHFRPGDAMALEFPDAVFDIVVCTHVYEHVPDAKRLMAEIARVLVPGGACYFSAGNRLAINEPHYHLPLLSVLPKAVAHLYLRLTGRGTHYYEEHRTLGGLRELTADFVCHDYTRALIVEPERYGTGYMLAPGSWKARFARLVVQRAYWLCPGYVWVLQKPGEPPAARPTSAGRSAAG